MPRSGSGSGDRVIVGRGIPDQADRGAGLRAQAQVGRCGGRLPIACRYDRGAGRQCRRRRDARRRWGGRGRRRWSMLGHATIEDQRQKRGSSSRRWLCCARQAAARRNRAYGAWRLRCSGGRWWRQAAREQGDNNQQREQAGQVARRGGARGVWCRQQCRHTTPPSMNVKVVSLLSWEPRDSAAHTTINEDRQ